MRKQVQGYRCVLRPAPRLLLAGVAVGLTAVSSNMSSFQLVLGRVTRLVEYEVDTTAARRHLAVSTCAATS